MKGLIIGAVVGFVLVQMGVPLALIIGVYVLFLLYVLCLFIWEEYIR